MAAYYGEAGSYRAALLAASTDEVSFGESERNALRGAYRMLIVQNGRILPSQRNVGNARGECKLECLRYTIYLGQHSVGVYVDVRHCPDNRVNSYYLSGDRPIRLVEEPNRRAAAWIYNWKTGRFEEQSDYVIKIWFDRDEIEEIDEETFVAEVDLLREKLADAEGGEIEPAGKNHSFAVFEAICRREIPGYPESPRVMEAMNRVLAISWGVQEDLTPSQTWLVEEYVRRIIIWIRKFNITVNAPIWDRAEALFPGDSLSEAVQKEVQRLQVHEVERKICLCYLHGEQMLEQIAAERQPLENPYEPLIFLMERGGRLRTLRESEILVWRPFNHLSLDLLEQVPSALLTFEKLNRIDEAKGW